MSIPTDAEATPPPWVIFPELSVDESTNQGAVEAYLTLDWLPMWLSLSPRERDAYLDRWNASPTWRAAIAERYSGDDPVDAAESAAAEAAYRAAHPQPKRWWRR